MPLGRGADYTADVLSETDLEHLQAGAGRLGVELDDTQVRKLDGYVERMLAWNQKVNLTAVTDPRAIVDKHLLDSLALVPLIPAEARTVVDIGTGPGLPSIVLSIALPRLEITAVESISKKAMFVRAVARELSVGVRVEPVRLEALDRTRVFDVAVSRATFDPPEWVDRGQVLVGRSGLLIAMLSEHQPTPPAPPGFTQQPRVDRTIGGALRGVVGYRREP
jgi:16S rRNA (guanine527-N7)-methyltransferase